jgi:hypothetical protein
VSTRLLSRFLVVLAILTVTLFFLGCASRRGDTQKPTMGQGEGAIAGQLVDANGDPFDLTQGGEGGAKSLRIDLTSPASGIVAAAYPQKKESRFVFSNIKPGAYEISVYWVVPGQRTIAGSLPVSVNADQVTPVKLPLTVSPLDTSR